MCGLLKFIHRLFTVSRAINISAHHYGPPHDTTQMLLSSACHSRLSLLLWLQLTPSLPVFPHFPSSPTPPHRVPARCCYMDPVKGYAALSIPVTT